MSPNPEVPVENQIVVDGKIYDEREFSEGVKNLIQAIHLTDQSLQAKHHDIKVIETGRNVIVAALTKELETVEALGEVEAAE